MGFKTEVQARDKNWDHNIPLKVLRLNEIIKRFVENMLANDL